MSKTRFLTALLAAIMLPAAFFGCSTGTDPVSNKTAAATDSSTDVPATVAPTPTPQPTPIPDPSTVTLMIEDFNGIT
ncbi:MAG: hypothetical protein J6V14_10550, partial [Clostridia bacterium]|nr:hypothetical protein [Clostridia bacterium]